MAEKFIITADRTHLRIYRYSQAPGQFTPSIQPVNALDLPEIRSYPGSEGEFSGRFQPNRVRSALEEGMATAATPERTVPEQLAAQISAFMEQRPNSTWDLGAPAALRNELIDALPESVRRRLDQVVVKDLVNVPPAEIRAQFAL